MAGMSAPKPRRWFVPRYSLRTLLVVMTVVCLVSGSWLNKAFRQREAVRRFYQLRGGRSDPYGLVTILYRHEGQIQSQPNVPEWLHPLRDAIGDEAFGDPIGVQLQHTSATDDDLRNLEDVPTIEQLWLSRTNVTDQGMRSIQACPNLKVLDLDHTAITDDGIAPLATLKKLEFLSLTGTKVSDEGVRHLMRMTNLKEVRLKYTAISDDGFRELQTALPRCTVETNATGYFQGNKRLNPRDFPAY